MPDQIKVLRPLPRVNEIGAVIQAVAHYFQQAQNGVYVRQALWLQFLVVFNR